MYSPQNPHPSYLRLVEALGKITGKAMGGTTAVGAELGGSPQLAGNWPTRGVSAPAALDVQRKRGINAIWILEGTGPMTIGGVGSQGLILDPDRLGTALTSIDKALADTHIQGKLGKLANTLISALAAQQKHYPNGVPEDARPVYDDLVAGYLERDLHDDRRATGRVSKEGAEGNSQPAAEAKKAGRRG